MSNRKIAQSSEIGSGWIPRVWHSKSGKMTVKCGCCDEKVVIYSHSDKDGDDQIEINGVTANKEEWRKILGL